MNGRYKILLITDTDVVVSSGVTVYPVRLTITVAGSDEREVTKATIPISDRRQVIPLQGIVNLTAGQVVTFEVRVNAPAATATATVEPATRVTMFKISS